MSQHSLYFSKYHGTGNDFIIIDEGGFPKEIYTPDVLRNLCCRHTGIGADGLILVKSIKDNEISMTYFNSDGYEGSMCGNGGRCAVAFALHKQMISHKAQILVHAVDGIHKAEFIKTHPAEPEIKISIQNSKLPVCSVENTMFIDTGSPHIVVETTDTTLIDLLKEGKRLRNHSQLQPHGANINFISTENGNLFVRTYERGVENETLSCGTGVTASAITWAFLQQKTGKQHVNVITKGGILQVEFELKLDGVYHISLKGTATYVFEGKISI